MIIYGYAKQSRYNNDGIYEIQVRVPQIHGPYFQSDAKGKTIHNYVGDNELPYYEAVISKDTRVVDGDVVILQSDHDGLGANFTVVGVTGASYYTSMTK